MRKSFLALVVLALLVTGGLQAWRRANSETEGGARGGRPEEAAPVADSAVPAAPQRTWVRDAVVRNHGRVVHRGRVDLSETIDRIRQGRPHPHRNDGAVFRNREGLLPPRRDGYYREYVHPTEGVAGPGPQRVVLGEGGEWYYSPDHYDSFIPLR